MYTVEGGARGNQRGIRPTPVQWFERWNTADGTPHLRMHMCAIRTYCAVLW